jgi:endonuclease/exonuclease/phosphatase family metal-dependent hydrolase
LGTPSYANALTAGFADAWEAANRGEPGLTFSHAPDLRNPTLQLTQRIDYVLTRGRWAVERVTTVGADPTNRTTTDPPLWPSDHLGVVATLRWED